MKAARKIGTWTAVRSVERDSEKHGERWRWRCWRCELEMVVAVRLISDARHKCEPEPAAPKPTLAACPFPLVRGRDGKPVSPVWRQHQAPKPINLIKLAIAGSSVRVQPSSRRRTASVSSVRIRRRQTLCFPK
jgi:hypothetical protein